MSIWTETLDPEYQGWLVFMTLLTDALVFLFPFWLSGSGSYQLRRLAGKLQRKYRIYFFFSVAFTTVSLMVALFFAPEWGIVRILQTVLAFVVWIAERAPDFIYLLVVLVVAGILIQSQDKVKAILGLEHVTLVKTTMRDVFTCFDMRRFKPIELFIWKAVNLPKGNLIGANNVFLEISCGTNEVVKTRVHHGAGESAMIREAVQLNFDPNDPTQEIYIVVKSQGIVGAATLGEVTLSNADVMEQINQWTGGAWHSTMFEWNNSNMFEYPLKPNGSLWFRINAVDLDEEEEARKGAIIECPDCMNPQVQE